MSTRLFIYILVFVSVTHMKAQSPEETFEPPDYLDEELYYLISYSFLNAGTAKITFKTDSATQMTHIVADAKTIGLANVLYKIRDIYECYMDPSTGYPYKAIRNVREGSYSEYNEVMYDFNSRSDSTIVHSQKSGTRVVPPHIFDILTGFFHFRKNFVSRNMEPGEMFVIKTYFTDEVWDLKIKYAGKETIKTKMGKIQCIKFNPITEVGRAFKTEHDMSVWFTDDENHLPVKIWLDLRFGSVTSELREYRNLKHEFSSLK